MDHLGILSDAGFGSEDADDLEHPALVERVKEFQRGAFGNKQKWWSYCRMRGKSSFDPARHDEVFLKGFFKHLEADEPENEDISPEDELKASLVLQIKEFQRSAPEHKEQWYAFCKLNGNSNYDPDRHATSFLQTFMRTAVPMTPWTSSNGGWGGCGGWGSGFGSMSSGLGKGDLRVSEKIFVGGLPKHTSKETVSRHFSQYGVVTDVSLKFDQDGNFRGFAFVTFDSVETARAVLDNYDCNSFEGKWIDCKPAKTPPGQTSSTGKGGCWDDWSDPFGWDMSWFGMMPWMGMPMAAMGKGPGKPALRSGAGPSSKGARCKSNGSDSSAQIFVGGLPTTATQEAVSKFFSQFGPVTEVHLKYDPTGTFRGFGFVTFESEEFASLVLENYEDNVFQGKWIDCKPAGSMPGKSTKGCSGKGSFAMPGIYVKQDYGGYGPYGCPSMSAAWRRSPY